MCQFLGAFNDNVLRLAIVAMVSFGVLKSENSGVYVQLSAALFMFPFFLFSAVAGDIIDRIDKKFFLLMTKLAELVIVIFVLLAIYEENISWLLLSCFAMGVQSAFFGPLKYSLLPTLIANKDLVGGNAWFSISTFAAILMGVVVGTTMGQMPTIPIALPITLLSVASLGLVFAAGVIIPQKRPSDWQWRDFSITRSYKSVLSLLSARPPIFHLILAGSWFWLSSALILNELAAIDEQILYQQLLFCLFLGVIIGGGICFLLFRKTSVSTQYAPLTLFLLGFILIIFSFFFKPHYDSFPITLALLVVLYAALATVYVVPIRTKLQVAVEEDIRARIISGYNIFNALFIVLATLMATLTHVLIDDATFTILLVAGGLSVIVAPLLIVILPYDTIVLYFRALLKFLLRVEIVGKENLKNNKSLFVCNHLSFWDGPLLAIFLEDEKFKFRYVIDSHQAENPYFRFVLNWRENLYPNSVFFLNPLNPQSLRRLIKESIRSPERCSLIFPEGRISSTGGLMKSYPGSSILTEKASDRKVTPICIEGVEYSTLSRMKGKFQLRWFPKVRITVGQTQEIKEAKGIRGKERRNYISENMGAILENHRYASSYLPPNLTQMFVDSANRHGQQKELFADTTNRRLNYRQVYRAAYALGQVMKPYQNTNQSRIGILLPSSIGACVVFYAAQFYAWTPVMLNPSTGAKQVLSACKTTTLDVVFTAEKLIKESAAVSEIVILLKKEGINVVTLESLQNKISRKIKIQAQLACLMLQHTSRRLPGFSVQNESIAAVLFTSGSEGAPKGVALSHRNLLSNSLQVNCRINTTHADSMFNALPVFHSFGLLAGVVLPAFSGVLTWQYPSPLHYRAIPEMLYASNSTILFSANTFLYQYGRMAHAFDFFNLRLVIAGAEKLQEKTYQQWSERFGIRILEGYGVTETSPALSVNTPLYYKKGTVGKILPGIETKLENSEGVVDGQRLWVRGNNIMSGYYQADSPGVIQSPVGGWHDTGDIVKVDENRYLTILGRQRRFIKVAGEMVPLDRVEEELRAHWQKNELVVVGVEDAKRGQKLALMTTAEISMEELLQAMREQNIPDLWRPKLIHTVKTIPSLPTGKYDYQSIKNILEDLAMQAALSEEEEYLDGEKKK